MPPPQRAIFGQNMGVNLYRLEKRIYICHLGPKGHGSCEFEEKIRKFFATALLG
jgi:hypothetical protein